MQAAMAENLAASDSNPNEDFNLAYNKCSDGGWGMIMTGPLSVTLRIQQIIIPSLKGNVQVDVDHLGNFKDPAVQTDHDAKSSKLWKSYAKASQKHGTPTIVQIAHPGRQSLRGAGRRGLFTPTIAPSAIPLRIGTNFLDSVITSLAFPKPREMDQKDINTVIRLFVDSARFIAESGFSGIELHAAHGYLLGEFNLACIIYSIGIE
jgi:2,4-dienoyl-CoA reductase-like NADH-dependent reductase (Old Yellow Enzyme family)